MQELFLDEMATWMNASRISFQSSHAQRYIERETERDREIETQRDRERRREGCVCVGGRDRFAVVPQQQSASTAVLSLFVRLVIELRWVFDLGGADTILM